MAKATKTKTQKGGRKPAKGSKPVENPEEEVQDIFGEGDEPEGDETPDVEVDEGELDQFGRPIVKPKASPAGEEDEEPEEEPEGDEEEPEEEPEGDDKTQAAKVGKGKGKPASLEQAALLELLPEKFRGEDLTGSIQKLIGSFEALEASDGKTKQELAQATRILESLGKQVVPKPGTPTPAPAVTTPSAAVEGFKISPEEEQELQQILGDMDLLTDPVLPMQKIYTLARKQTAEQSKNDLVAAMVHYQRQAKLDAFATAHDDFEALKPLMIEVIKTNPHLDHPEALEMVYEKARELRQAQEVAQTTKTTESVVSNEQFAAFLEKRDKEIANRVKKELLSQIGKGQAVKGTLDSGSSTTPTSKERVNQPGVKKRYRIQTPAGDMIIDDEEVAGIITAEEHDHPDLLNL